MKKLLLLFVSTLLCASSIAQSSKGFSFQGYARGADGSALQNIDVNVRFTIFSSDVNDPEFAEIQTLSTDEFGVFQAVVGTVKSSDFEQLSFASNDYSLKVEVEDGGVYQEVTTTSLLAVPYAKAAERATEAESVKSGSNGVPVGTIVPFAGPDTKVPDGWLLCNGDNVSRTTYAALFAIIGEYWGEGNNSTTFNLPDMRGVFLRGVSGTSTDSFKDPNASSRGYRHSGGNTGNNVGSYQSDEYESHKHDASSSSTGSHSHYTVRNVTEASGSLTSSTTIAKHTDSDHGDSDEEYYLYGSTSTANIGKTNSSGSHSHTITTDKEGGNETRPQNAFVNYIIKY